ncbi:Uncharacterised protein [Yersinia bercovieri]|nr:Uncharacterised protein [Yersinia bercovieri]CNI13760.1 Uncharacterised protein [Yersinia bercovieri]
MQAVIPCPTAVNTGRCRLSLPLIMQQWKLITVVDEC